MTPADNDYGDQRVSMNHKPSETIEIEIEIIDGTTEKFTMVDASWDDIDYRDGMLMLRSRTGLEGVKSATLIPLHRIAIMHARGDV